MGGVDLHLHSTASDGRLTPIRLVQKAAALDLRFIALADHDTIDGIPEALAAAATFPTLKVIPCVEISTDTSHGEVHVLGYFLDYEDRDLKAQLKKFRDSRLTRAQRMIAKLAGLGIKIEWDRVQEIAGQGSIGRPHLAQAMLEKGYISSLRDAFTQYLGQGKPAYVEREKMIPEEAVELIVRARGLPVLAHPFTITQPESMLPGLVGAGLIGIEAYYGRAMPEEIQHFIDLASKYHLLVTGGSDYHGLDDASEVMMGSVDVPLECALTLIALARERLRVTSGN